MPIRAAALFLLLIHCNHANAASMRCGNSVVKNNDSPSAVRKRCGKPDRQASATKVIYVDGVRAKQRVELWTYYQGRASIPR
jgi:hypothetical protein